jgi:penicillin amidase
VAENAHTNQLSKCIIMLKHFNIPQSLSHSRAVVYDRTSVAPAEPSVDHANQSAARHARRPGLRRFFRVIAILIICLTVIIFAGAAWFYWEARHALPQLDGKLYAHGLSAEVQVFRDAHGIPHIIASNTKDLFFAQGYVTAQDRLWQMDFSRRLVSGTMSEVMGPALLNHDKEQRIVGLRQIAERSWEALSARDRSHFEAYAAGINAYIEARRGNLPIEFRVLRYSPEPWTGLDSLLCGILMSQGLNYTLYETKLVRERFVAKLGPELAADLYPNSSWRDHPPGLDQKVAPVQESLTAPDPQSPQSSSFIFGLAPADMHSTDGPQIAGSNNWVISGAHTTSGKPLLANDMHLEHHIPNTWYEAHLEVSGQNGQPEFDVVGFTLPGFPYVLVGHNQHIAWGFTNLVPDVEDVYIENVKADGEYQTPDGWKQMETRHEVIRVKGKPDVQLDVKLTRHGPIVTDIVATQLFATEKRMLALKWAAYNDPVTVPFFDIDTAQNWQEFRTSLSHFSSPSQNVVYADVDGNIGYQAAGHVPIRKSGDGSLPVSGSDDLHEWIGYIPFDKLPATYNPVSGIIATANNKVTPPGYPYSIATQWGSPYRTERIYQALELQKKFTAEDMLKLQIDTYSAFDRFCGQRFAAAVGHSSKASARAHEAAKIMQEWEGWVSADLAAPTLINETRQEIFRLLLEPKLKSTSSQSHDDAPDWTDYEWFMSSVALENFLTQLPPRWLPPSFTSYDDLLANAVENVVNQKTAPSDLASWRWGQQSALHLQHPIFGKIPILKHWSGPGRVPQSGDRYTVKQTSNSAGPSERMTVDLANLDGSEFNVLTGQSGQLFSPHYMDQWQAWYKGFSFQMPFSDVAVVKAKSHELILAPR